MNVNRKDVRMFSVSLLFVFLLFAGASCRADRNACVITEEELKEILHSIVDVYGKDFKLPKSINCYKLIAQADSCTSELKTYVSSKVSASDEKYNTAVATYKRKEDQQNAKIRNVPSSKMAEYQKVINEIGNKIKDLHENINRLNLEKEKHLIDISYYQDVLSNGTKFSSRFDLDSYFKTAKTCSFKRDVILGLIRKFNEIFEMTLGIPRSSQGDCFEELRLQLENVDGVISSRIGDDRVESLKNTYDERMRVYQRLTDDYFLEIEQEGEHNITEISDQLQKLTHDFNTLEIETKTLKRESLINAMKTVRTLIRSGNKMRKAKQLYTKIQVDLINPYQMVLKRTYSCDADYIPNVVVFAEMNSRISGYEIIAAEMQTCNQTESPFMLVMAKGLRNKTLDAFVEKIYEIWIGSIETENYAKIEHTMAMLPDTIDFKKLFSLALNKKLEMKVILKFIDGLHAYSQNIIVDLYEVMMELGYREKQEHIEIALWIRDKLHWIHQQPSQSAITGDLEDYLKELTNEMSKGLKIFLFEPSVIFSMKNHEYLLRSDTHNSVKYKYVVDTTGKFFRFEDERYQKTFSAENVTDASGTTAVRIRVGTGNTDADYWQIILTDNDDFFYLKNKANGHFLSSEEDKICMGKNSAGTCDKNEWMNRAHVDNTSPTTKWMFTDKLIRNGILPDRFE